MIISYKTMTSEAENSLHNSQWKDWQHRNIYFLCTFSWFSTTHSKYQLVRRLEFLPKLGTDMLSLKTTPSALVEIHPHQKMCISLPPSCKMIDGCHRSEKLLKKLSGWREKRSEEVFLSSTAFVSGQLDPLKPLTLQPAAPMGKVSLTMHRNVQMWMSVGKCHSAYHLAEEVMWVPSNSF